MTTYTHALDEVFKTVSSGDRRRLKEAMTESLLNHPEDTRNTCDCTSIAVVATLLQLGYTIEKPKVAIDGFFHKGDRVEYVGGGTRFHSGYVGKTGVVIDDDPFHNGVQVKVRWDAPDSSWPEDKNAMPFIENLRKA